MNKMSAAALALVCAFGLTSCAESARSIIPETATSSTETPLESTMPERPLATTINATGKDEQKQRDLLEQQIRMLEKAVAAKTPEKAVQSWAEAVFTRNGAWEYAMTDPATRASHRKIFTDGNWVTGTSSPWMKRYRIGKGTKRTDGTYVFKVQFDYRTSDDADRQIAWSDIEPFDVRVRKSNDFWYVVKK
ncbi:hypothetical protein D7Z26_04505 [Cohnella endophytica]|uniref:Uncharacterized protein n=1 Tax=Cohnella endophytica TaxID=2419778 RepID=A0A494Y4Q4_9BACL|nr:hypothetical protein [Cohnella endophytica]RKP57251.1 hypothetical protein D7Z26_04505 [Cohnella endophytica]